MVGDKYGFMDATGKIVIEPQFDYAHKLYSEGLCFVKVGEKSGFIDNSGYIVVELPDTIEHAFPFKYGYAKVYSKNWREGVINKQGELVIPAIFPGFTTSLSINGDIVTALCYIGENRKERMLININVDGSVDKIIKNNIGYFCNGLCKIYINGKYGFINNYGELVIDTIYDYTGDFTDDGVVHVEINDEIFYIDKTGKKLFSVDEIISDFSCNRAVVIQNGKTCLIDATGKLICNIDYDEDEDEIEEFNVKDNMATIYRDGCATKIDTMGNVVLNTNYKSIGTFVGDVAPVRSKDGKCGFIDINGNYRVCLDDDDFSFASSFHEEQYGLRAFNICTVKTENGGTVKSIEDFLCYYDIDGNLVWKDIPRHSKKTIEYYNANREDYIEYFDANIADLDPIEGIYYVTDKNYYQHRTESNIAGVNGTESKFCAISYDKSVNGFRMDFLDGSNQHWVNKFVRIGNSNTYAIQKIDKDIDYSSESSVTIDDFSKFGFTLDLGHNDWYNFFATYEFVRDYPTIAEMEKFQQTEWTGTGFAIADGYIVTNYHVTNGAKTIRIKGVNGDMEEAYKGFVVASDKEHDLSIVKIVDKDFEGFESIPYKIGKTMVDVGDDIFVLGYPMTQTMGEEVKLTNGVISAASGYKGDASMYQISAAVQSGNSGGPLFNEDGAVIGIVCAKHTGAENANYAVKVSYLYSLITSSNLGIDISGNDKVKGKSLSKQVKRIKDFVYLIECSSK